MNQPVGVLFMAYGGPDGLEDIPGYLADIRAGRTTSSALVDEITRNYRLIGGTSPLLRLTKGAVAATMRRLAEPTQRGRFRAYLGMRHWAPWIEETVGRMVDDGIERAVSLVMAPHYSTLSVAKYQKKVAVGLEMYRGAIEFEHVSSYHNAPGLIAALAERVRVGMERWSVADRSSVHVVFSAHSLPTRIMRMGDPYDRQLRETAQRVADKVWLPLSQWSWSYQSAGRSPEPWLGPQLEDHIAALAKKGVRKVVSVPIGFVSDHVEILYDIDIEAQAVARACGVRLERPPSLNSDPLFISALAAVILGAAGRAGWIAA